MEKNESDPLDTNEAEPAATITSETLSDAWVPELGHYFLTPYCCDGHNDQWLVPGMHSPGNVPGVWPPSYELGPVELMTPDEDQPQTVWRIYSNDDGTFHILNDAFLGGGTGILTAPYDDSPVVVVPETQAPWNTMRCRFRALPVLDKSWYMIQLVENPGVYLNVSGDGPYPAGTPILVYSSPGPPSGDSPGAEANQVWRFHLVKAD